MKKQDSAKGTFKERDSIAYLCVDNKIRKGKAVVRGSIINKKDG